MASTVGEGPLPSILGVNPIELATIGVPGILTLAVLAVLFGWIFPRATVVRLWKQLDAKDADNKELRETLNGLADAVGSLVDQMSDVKVANQATLYAMQEIQVAGRHAAGMEPLRPVPPPRLRQDRER